MRWSCGRPSEFRRKVPRESIPTSRGGHQQNTMDLSRMKNTTKLTLCRKYYLGGFACLPFLWFINVVWFFREAFTKPSFPQQAQMKQYVIRSAVGALLWLAVIITWIVIFQVNRADWGATADYMSFIIPKGIP
ncbi:Gamma-secretase subunit pen-2 [Lamellibrachia satsuma]|nr:Gamma-secretase subunit pen-2 [Lamellibrachia satsuma]